MLFIHCALNRYDTDRNVCLRRPIRMIVEGVLERCVSIAATSDE